MEFTDDALILLIKSGMSDEEIIRHVHENTKPADLYGAVAEVVSKVLHGDTLLLQQIKESENAAIQRFYSYVTAYKDDANCLDVIQWWTELGITRSDTKSIVMTYLYGSSEYGNRESIQDRIDERADEIMEKSLDAYWDRSGADMWKEQRTLAITVMVRLIRGAMSVVCPSTVDTMAWVQTMAMLLGARDVPMSWVTPLGFLVVQDNPNLITKTVQCYEDGSKRVCSLRIKVPDRKGKKLNADKMAAGSAPNFVHSMDACHLQLAAIRAATKYLHMIHDSMGSQFAEAPRFSEVLRDTFCEMYEESDVLFDMWVRNKGDEYALPEPKELGELDVGVVRDSKYFFH